MKKIFLIALLFLPRAQAVPLSAPQLFFSYSWLYDLNCANDDRKIDPAWATEATERTEEFAQMWTRHGPALFEEVFKKFGKGFRRKELTATLSVCPAPSYSHPLILNVNRFLRSHGPETPPFDDEVFVDLVFHELLHTWVSENLKTSALLTKYATETSGVRHHLHLMAVQKWTYLVLNRNDLVTKIAIQYEQMRGPAYKRAWQIVSEIEGHEGFLQELIDSL